MQAEILTTRSHKALSKNQRGFPGSKMVKNLPAKAGDTVSIPVSRPYILSLCLFNTYAEYIMQNARLDEAQAGIKIDGRNINNLRSAMIATLLQKEKRNERDS